MAYLFTQMFWYVLAALVLGVIVGWTTCSARDGQRR